MGLIESTFMAELAEAIQKEAASGSRMKTITKENFKEHMALLLERVTNFATILKNMPTSDKELLAKQIYQNSKQANIGCAAYVVIAKTVGKADLRVAFSSFEFVANYYINLLSAFNRNMDRIFQHKGINIFNVKVSHIAIVGLVCEIDQYVDISTALLDMITYEICGRNSVHELSEPKRYRSLLVQNNIDFLTKVLKTRTAKTAADTINDFNKQQAEDITLLTEHSESNVGFIRPENYSNDMKSYIQSGARRFIIFRWLGEQWNIIKHARYLKIKKEREWLEAHVALLQMELHNVDPDSEKYRQQVKVIDSYNQMIANLDEKIAKYMEG